MSNHEAGKLYEAVVEEVIADSRQDFEDSGIDESTLQDLKKLWCNKLSQLKICRFSWDDEKNQNHQTEETVLGETAITSESLQLRAGMDFPIPLLSYSTSTSLPTVDLTNGSYSVGIELPAFKQEIEDSELALPANQSDGSFELILNLQLNGAEHTMAGLHMKFLSQADGTRLFDDDDENDDPLNDSDGINSDLDDDLDSEKSDEDDGNQEGQVILCLYDKVQRVKNRWKCSLKEGIANIDAKDYVFQRAGGESEW